MRYVYIWSLILGNLKLVILYVISNFLFLMLQGKDKPKKNGRMSLDEAIDDSENLTDFLMDFDEEA